MAAVSPVELAKLIVYGPPAAVGSRCARQTPSLPATEVYLAFNRP